MKQRFSLLLLLMSAASFIYGQCDCPPLAERNEVVVSDAGQGTGTTTWTCDNTYILDGYVFVNSGQTLTIEPGTVIKGAAGAGSDASAFTVANGGTINAEALAECPIIFTFEGDPLDGSVSYDTRGQWGGVILLGDASTNFGGVAQIEGIPADNDRASYGGSNDAHSAGILRYVSIRHGGTQLAAANEINGLTLGGVGSGTTLDHIEVVSNLDDGIEFFGGTASITNALVAFCGDDSFDWDQGYRGMNNSTWLAIQDVPNGIGDRGGELDGDDSDDGNVSADEMPFSTPTVANWTVVSAGNNQGFLFRNGSGGNVINALISGTSEAIEIEHKTDEAEDAFDRWEAGDLNLSNIEVLGGTDAIDYDGSIVMNGDDQLDAYAATNDIVLSSDTVIDYVFAFDAAGGIATDTLALNGGQGSGQNFAYGWTFCDERGLFGQPVAGCMDEAACNYDPLAIVDDGSCDFIVVTLDGTTDAEGDSAGAASISVTGGAGVYTYSWTDNAGTEISTVEDAALFAGTYSVLATDSLGCSGALTDIVIDAVTVSNCDCPPLADRPEVLVADDGQGVGTTSWTCDNTYILNGYVFIQSGQVLTIDAGTVVKGAAGSGADASAMIVAKGGQLFAEGTADCPIIFTFAGDPLDGSVSYDTRGQWGGVIVLGDATTNFGGTAAQVEGIPSDNDLATYGGENDEDNSGVITYVSIRHGGTQLGAANEINGLTLAGVGSGTTIHHVEVVSNLDDGIEFFGGSVTVDNALVAFCGDDSFDWDQGYHGTGSNWLAIQDQPGEEGDRGGELDGDDSDDGNVSSDELPFAIPTVTGWTVVGVGGKQGLLLRNGSGGLISNALLCNTSEGIEIEDKADEVEDAYERWEAGDLTLENIVVTGGVDALDYDGNAADGDDLLDTYAEENMVMNGEPEGLDYLFGFDAAGLQANNQLFLEVDQGSGHTFAEGWTFCDERGLFGTENNASLGCTDDMACNYDSTAESNDGSCEFPGDECDDDNVNTINDVLSADCVCAGEDTTTFVFEFDGLEFGIFPNPTSGEVTFRVEGFHAGVTMQVMDGTGRMVWSEENLSLQGNVTFDLSHLSAGTYNVMLSDERGISVKRLAIQK